MLKIRWSHDHLIFNMGIPYLRKTNFILRHGPGSISAAGVKFSNKVFMPSTKSAVGKFCSSHHYHEYVIDVDSEVFSFHNSWLVVISLSHTTWRSCQGHQGSSGASEGHPSVQSYMMKSGEMTIQLIVIYIWYQYWRYPDPAHIGYNMTLVISVTL